ncbi:MAG: hypothetical protein ACRETC_09045, partial [Gammaproteobacteria bacterium]
MILVGNAACSRQKLAPIFVGHDGPDIDMLHLVETSPGHVSGALVVSSINKKGERKKDITYNITGTVYKGNV